MSKFLDRLNEGKEEKEKKANELVAANAIAQVQKKIADLTAKEATLKAALEAALGSSNFSIDRVFDLTKEASENKANLALAQEILKSEF